MTRPIFMVEDPWAGVAPSIRRSLTQLKYDATYVTKVFDICQKLGYQVERPIWSGMASAHMGIPRRKIAFYFVNFRETERITKLREAWKVEGWKMIAVQVRDVVATPTEQLSLQLAAALKELRK